MSGGGLEDAYSEFIDDCVYVVEDIGLYRFEFFPCRLAYEEIHLQGES